MALVLRPLWCTAPLRAASQENLRAIEKFRIALKSPYKATIQEAQPQLLWAIDKPDYTENVLAQMH